MSPPLYCARAHLPFVGPLPSVIRGEWAGGSLGCVKLQLSHGAAQMAVVIMSLLPFARFLLLITS